MVTHRLKNVELRVADLFCGAGGLSYGAEKAGFKIVAAYDSWKPATDTYSENHKISATSCDISDTSSITRKLKRKKIDIIIGGPPCQDFSSAGKGIEGDRAKLTVSFANIINELKPICFLMENVPTSAKSNAYSEAIEILSSAGYCIESIVVNAAHFGVPQRRRRLITVGFLTAPTISFTDALQRLTSDSEMSVREYFKLEGFNLPFDYYYRHPRSYSRRAVFSVNDPSPTIRGVNRPVPPNYVPHKGDATSTEDFRALTNSERALIQSFPDSFIWHGSNSEQAQMIGNAVPPKLAHSLFTALMTCLRTNPPDSDHG